MSALGSEIGVDRQETGVTFASLATFEEGGAGGGLGRLSDSSNYSDDEEKRVSYGYEHDHDDLDAEDHALDDVTRADTQLTLEELERYSGDALGAGHFRTETNMSLVSDSMQPTGYYDPTATGYQPHTAIEQGSVIRMGTSLTFKSVITADGDDITDEDLSDGKRGKVESPMGASRISGISTLKSESSGDMAVIHSLFQTAPTPVEARDSGPGPRQLLDLAMGGLSPKPSPSPRRSEDELRLDVFDSDEANPANSPNPVSVDDEVVEMPMIKSPTPKLKHVSSMAVGVDDTDRVEILQPQIHAKRDSRMTAEALLKHESQELSYSTRRISSLSRKPPPTGTHADDDEDEKMTSFGDGTSVTSGKTTKVIQMSMELDNASEDSESLSTSVGDTPPIFDEAVAARVTVTEAEDATGGESKQAAAGSGETEKSELSEDVVARLRRKLSEPVLDFDKDKLLLSPDMTVQMGSALMGATQQREALRRDLERSLFELEASAAQVNTYETALTDADEKYGILVEDYELLNEQKKVDELALERNETRIEEMQRRIAQLSQDLNASREHNELIVEENGRLKGRLKAMEHSRSESQAQLELTQSDLGRGAGQLSRREAELEGLRVERDRLLEQFSESTKLAEESLSLRLEAEQKLAKESGRNEELSKQLASASGELKEVSEESEQLFAINEELSALIETQAAVLESIEAPVGFDADSFEQLKKRSLLLPSVSRRPSRSGSRTFQSLAGVGELAGHIARLSSMGEILRQGDLQLPEDRDGTEPPLWFAKALQQMGTASPMRAPAPRRSSSRSWSLASYHMHDALKEFFVLLCLCVKLNLANKYGLTPDVAPASGYLWQQALANNILFHDYYDFIVSELSVIFEHKLKRGTGTLHRVVVTEPSKIAAIRECRKRERKARERRRQRGMAATLCAAVTGATDKYLSVADRSALGACSPGLGAKDLFGGAVAGVRVVSKAQRRRSIEARKQREERHRKRRRKSRERDSAGKLRRRSKEERKSETRSLELSADPASGKRDSYEMPETPLHLDVRPTLMEHTTTH